MDVAEKYQTKRKNICINKTKSCYKLELAGFSSRYFCLIIFDFWFCKLVGKYIVPSFVLLTVPVAMTSWALHFLQPSNLLLARLHWNRSALIFPFLKTTSCDFLVAQKLVLTSWVEFILQQKFIICSSLFITIPILIRSSETLTWCLGPVSSRFSKLAGIAWYLDNWN